MSEKKIIIKGKKNIINANLEKFKNICMKNGINDIKFIENKFETLLKKKDIITEKDIFTIDDQQCISPTNLIHIKKKKKKKKKSNEEWLINKAESLWIHSDNNNDGYIDYEEFKLNICSKYKGLVSLPETIKRMLYLEIAGEDRKISKKEFKTGFFDIFRNYINILKSKEGKKVQIFKNKGYTLEMKKNSSVVIGVGVGLSILTAMIIMHKIQN